MMADLAQLPRVRIDREVEEAATRAQQELAEIGHHRISPSDLIIAACAHIAQMGVLHYDGDYDLLAERTSLEFESSWLGPRRAAGRIRGPRASPWISGPTLSDTPDRHRSRPADSVLPSEVCHREKRRKSCSNSARKTPRSSISRMQ